MARASSCAQELSEKPSTTAGGADDRGGAAADQTEQQLVAATGLVGDPVEVDRLLLALPVAVAAVPGLDLVGRAEADGQPGEAGGPAGQEADDGDHDDGGDGGGLARGGVGEDRHEGGHGADAGW